MSALGRATTQEQRFYALGDAAKTGFAIGKVEDARKYADELLALSPKFKENWNYGNALHDGNMVLGRVALAQGKTEEAKKYLLEAGRSPGSPQIDSFGPNMSLAKDLLEHGERQAVVDYLERCRSFWSDGGKINAWEREIRAGKVPDFGANLFY